MIVITTPRVSPASQTGTARGLALGDNYGKILCNERREEIKDVMPPNYEFNSQPAGPCTFEISNYLRCAYEKENIEECKGFKQMLCGCLKSNKLDTIPPNYKD